MSDLLHLQIWQVYTFAGRDRLKKNDKFSRSFEKHREYSLHKLQVNCDIHYQWVGKNSFAYEFGYLIFDKNQHCHDICDHCRHHSCSGGKTITFDKTRKFLWHCRISWLSFTFASATWYLLDIV